MILRGILFFILVAAYVIPLIWLLYAGIRAKRSKEYADFLGIRTKGDLKQWYTYAVLPCVNMVFLYYFLDEVHKRRVEDSTPLHKPKL